MTFPENAPLLLRPFPAGLGPGLRLFQNYPCAPGLYGAVWEGDVRVSGNYLDELTQLAGLQQNVLALDTGGLPLRSALALGHLRLSDLSQALAALPEMQRPTALYLPQSLTLAWKIGATLEQIPVTRLPDFVPLFPALETLTASLRLWPGQALLFSLALLLFGWQAWLMGMAALFSAALLLGLLWNFLPVPPALRGLTLGVLLGLTFLALTWNSLPQIWPRLIGFCLAPAWYGFLLTGTRR